ncbi:hypothetical protein CU102_03030 [Phyllobacterium brassicacearum]|uniref:Uncharacterized protein n=1 Tax=Phyllobacterium brassicacearum TaxID=314235 RepID=A0A2P7BUG4_9HYPH|nr:hypothetical protein CU102_03030 [Phyllobacterium brassicacearum]
MSCHGSSFEALGAYHGIDESDRRDEIVHWFLVDERFPEDKMVLGALVYELALHQWKEFGFQ